jgi:hypothetical protein
VDWENKLASFDVKNVATTAAVSNFPDEFYRPGEAELSRHSPNTSMTTGSAKAGHFTAREQPRIVTEELRATFRSPG